MISKGIVKSYVFAVNRATAVIMSLQQMTTNDSEALLLI